MPYLKIIHRFILRPLRAEPVRTGLTVLAVALGVAVVLAIEMAGQAAAGSFRSSMESLAGKADFEVTAAGGVPAAAAATLARLPFALKVRSRIEDFAIVTESGKTVPLIGIDVLSDSAIEHPAQEAATGESASFSRRETIFVGRKLGWSIGQRVSLLINDRAADYEVRGLLPESAGDTIAMDLAPATSALGRNGILDRVLIELPPNSRIEDFEPVLTSALGPGVTLSRFGARAEENRRMLAAFRWNLRVLSYIALIVGAFLIYNTISVSVVRRRAEIGILRALGAPRSRVLAAFLAEAAAFGIAGGLLGIVLGRVLAESAVRLVSATVESLYVSSTPGEIALTGNLALIGLGAGLAVAIASALGPAWEASRVAPVEAMSRNRREHIVRLHWRRSLLIAGLLAVCAAIAAKQPPVGRQPVFGYLSALLLIGMLAASVPPLVAGFAAISGGMLRRAFGVEALLATRGIAGSMRRTSVLVGALATAIAMTAAVGIMVGSFRQTVLAWMNDRLQADIYVRPAGSASANRHPTMSADTANLVRRLPEVREVDSFRAYEISYQGAPVTLGGSDAHIAAGFPRMTAGEDVVVVSEPFANKHNVRVGDKIALRLGEKAASFQVLDIYYDYASERGYIVMNRATLLRYLPDPAVSNLAVYLKPGVEIEAAKQRIESALSGRKLFIATNRTLREEAIRTFDRTFAITYALEAVAIFVAVMGVAGALLALVIDRRREFGLLRFLGGAQAQLRRIVLFEAGLLGLLASVAGLIVGVLLSLLLIFVINKQSFGWTIQFHWPVAVLLGSFSLIFAVTVLSALYPARVAARLNPIEVIHEE